MGLRVVQWATGGVGVAAIKGVLEHPDLELVGCWVHSQDKAGRTSARSSAPSPLGVIATNSIDEILALDADAVIYAPLMANPDEVAALLRSGKNVVTPVGWLYPSERSAAPMREAALEGNATLHGTGIAPGGISEKFPLLFSAFSTGVTFVRAEEFSDLRTYDAPDVLRHVMGFGEVPEKALTGPMQKMLDSGFIQAVKMFVDKMGFNADPKMRATQEIAVATAPIDSPLGVIEPGQVAGRKFHWEALVDGEPVVRVTVNWLMGEENLDPAWTFGPAGQRYEMEVRGNPDITIIVKGFHSEIGGEGPEYGIVGTAAHCVNSVPAVCAAEPGILTLLDLPLISGKAAPATRLVSGHDEAVGGRAVPHHRDGSGRRLPRHGPDAAARTVPPVVRPDPADQGNPKPDRRLGCRRAVPHRRTRRRRQHARTTHPVRRAAFIRLHAVATSTVRCRRWWATSTANGSSSRSAQAPT